MAWGGKHNRMTAKQRNYFLRTANRRLPPRDNPHGVPTKVLRALAWQQLPFDKEIYQRQLSELLAAYELNGG